MLPVQFCFRRPQAVELQAHFCAPRLDAYRRRRPGKVSIARRPIEPRPRLRSTTSVYQARVLLAPPHSAFRGGEKRDRRAYTCKYACAHVFVVNSPFPAVPPARRGCTQHSTSRAANKEAHTPLGLLLRVIPPTNPRPQGQGAAAACAASPHSGIFHPSRIPPLK